MVLAVTKHGSFTRLSIYLQEDINVCKKLCIGKVFKYYSYYVKYFRTYDVLLSSVYVCPHLSMYVLICSCVSSSVHVCLHLSVNVLICPCQSSFDHICPHLSMCVFICPCMSSFVHVCPHMSMYVLICPCMSSFVHVCPHFSLHVLICSCLFWSEYLHTCHNKLICL